jgi:uncharacterized protein YdbL (DUF1318 family)
MTKPIALEQRLNDAVFGIHQCRKPLTRARNAGELIEFLQHYIDGLADTRRRAVAEAVQWPNMSMQKVADELNVSKSTIAKLASPGIRDDAARDIRARLEGISPA